MELWSYEIDWRGEVVSARNIYDFTENLDKSGYGSKTAQA